MTKSKNPYEQFVNVDYASLSDWVFSFSGPEFAIIGTIIGVVISSQLNVYQQNAIGNFFEQIGQTLLTTGAQESNQLQTNSFNMMNNSSGTQTINQKINQLDQEVRKLKEELYNLKNKKK